MRALRDLGHDCHLVALGKEARRVNAEEFCGDILVLARQTCTDIWLMLDEMRAKLPVNLLPKVVYEIDDDPWEWHSWDPVHQELGAEYSRRVTEVMRRCDAITCSTRTLAIRIRREMPDKYVYVVPNAIDYQIRDWSVRENRADYGLEDQIILGWTGSIHHDRDVDVMMPAVKAILLEYPNTMLLLQCDPAVYRKKTENFKALGLDSRVKWALPVPFDNHPGVYSLFDINLAPLENTAFNRCKSDLRLIEGGAHGVPYVASNVAPYAEFHEESGGIGGYIASTPGEWIDGLRDLIDEEREARGSSLARYVRERRSLAVAAGQWQTAFQCILTQDETPMEEPVSWDGTPPGRNDACPCGSGLKYKRCCRGAYG